MLLLINGWKLRSIYAKIKTRERRNLIKRGNGYNRERNLRMKTNIGKLLLCMLAVLLMSGWTQEARMESVGEQSDMDITFLSDIREHEAAQTDVQAEDENIADSEQSESGMPLTTYQMVANLRLSGIGEEKNEAICLIAEMLFADGKEAEFVAGVCGNVLCEGRNGMFERDWGGSAQKYLPSRMSGDPYEYASKYANRHIYEGFSLSEVYKMAKDLYYSYNWDAGKYQFGLGCVQWTHKRTVMLIEYYMEEAGESDTITREQCIAAEMKFMEYELNNTETGAYEHWTAGDHKSQYKNEAARAGYCVAKYYERCHSDYYSMRAERAEDVYEAMNGNYKSAAVQGQGEAD